MRKVLEIKECMKTFEGDGIPVTRAFPVPTMRELDPFLLFDHFGPIHYEPGGATGVPAHPHCGFEAITYLLGGEVEHQDSWGGQAFIETGDIQWMTTGSGLIHSELVTEKFKKSGGIMQGLQIWVNLPKKNKQFNENEINQIRKDNPGIKIIAHPECPPDVINASDFAGSTSGMIKYVEDHQPKKVMMVTECSMSDNVKIDNPNVEFIRPCNLCPYMKKITLPKILDCLENETGEIIMDSETIKKARISVERMTAVGR